MYRFAKIQLSQAPNLNCFKLNFRINVLLNPLKMLSADKHHLLYYIPNNTISLSSTTCVSRRMRCSQGSSSEDFFSNSTR